MFVLAYDIACARRLRRVARYLERHATRCQRSVFLFRGNGAAVDQLLEGIVPLIDSDEDCVQAWELCPGEPMRGRLRGRGLTVESGYVVLGGNGSAVIQGDSA